MARQHRPGCFARHFHCSNPQQQRSRTAATTTAMTGRVHKGTTWPSPAGLAMVKKSEPDGHKATGLCLCQSRLRRGPGSLRPAWPADCEARSEDIMVKGCPAVLILRRCLGKIRPSNAPQLGSERERARRSIKDPSPRVDTCKEQTTLSQLRGDGPEPSGFGGREAGSSAGDDQCVWAQEGEGEWGKVIDDGEEW
ncbi:hypothetical protein BC939DRAFT_493950 [Gamsiella multidivaricata]|uniref:uncharacterized protein n=1 Tax=Gamsiella multidivaricata TaxID=101098 RepID=UPI00221FCE7A|nr:uncharacterized protein BC939DRAFT_493950 [Gamsiella multidivaricata]KAI7821730.1 hypothetical protein BC939DRAFT_493950 [Gamsiella multidivaricata]